MQLQDEGVLCIVAHLKEKFPGVTWVRDKPVKDGCSTVDESRHDIGCSNCCRLLQRTVLLNIPL